MRIKHTILAGVGLLSIIIGGNWWLKTRPAKAFNENTAPKVSMVEAIEKVLNSNPGTAAVDVNLSYENNQLAWEVILNNDLEVYIDANSKEIIKTEQAWNLAEIPFIGNWAAD